MNDVILLIDKDPAVIEIISLLLEEQGYRCVIAAKPFSIAQVYELMPKLVVLHNGLDGLGGQICRELKASKELRDIPVLMSSTRADIAELASSCGAEAWIAKPFDIDNFCALADSMLKVK